jgi:molybdopterin-guanine dinucleotide biosynthesis protein A
MGKEITAAILAGGPASRMGGVIKPEILLAGKTILEHSLSVLRIIFSEIILVTNSPEIFTGYGDLIITSDHYKGIGPIGGIHAAIKAASGDAVFVFAGDMPLLYKDLIVKQSDLFEESGCEILVPRAGKDIEPLHSIYSRTLLARLEDYLSTTESRAVRDFFLSANVKFMDVDTDMTSKFFNINSHSDITVAERIIKTGRHNTL